MILVIDFRSILSDRIFDLIDIWSISKNGKMDQFDISL